MVRGLYFCGETFLSGGTTAFQKEKSNATKLRENKAVPLNESQICYTSLIRSRRTVSSPFNPFTLRDQFKSNIDPMVLGN